MLPQSERAPGPGRELHQGQGPSRKLSQNCPTEPCGDLPPKWAGTSKPNNITSKPNQVLRSKEIFPFRLWTYLGPVTSVLFLISPFFGMEMFILCLSHCCISEAHYVFGFTGSQLEKSFPQYDSSLESHTYLI